MGYFYLDVANTNIRLRKSLIRLLMSLTLKLCMNSATTTKIPKAGVLELLAGMSAFRFFKNNYTML